MRNILPFTAVVILFSSITPHSVQADVGQCWILFVYNPISKVTLDADQQKELGERLMNTHAGSSEADGHTLFICEIDTHDDGQKGVLYRVSETSAELGHRVRGFRLTAKSFVGLRLAVREVELAAKENSIAGLRSGRRTKLLRSPIYKKRSAK